MYRPLPLYLTVQPSLINGIGLFALDNISPNTVMGITHIYSVGFENDHIRTPLGGFINHSDIPNCILFNEGFTKKIKTLKSISKGEEILLQYTLYQVDK